MMKNLENLSKYDNKSIIKNAIATAVWHELNLSKKVNSNKKSKSKSKKGS